MVHTRLHTVEPLNVKTPDRHTVVAAQPSLMIEHLTCTWAIKGHQCPHGSKEAAATAACAPGMIHSPRVSHQEQSD